MLCTYKYLQIFTLACRNPLMQPLTFIIDHENRFPIREETNRISVSYWFIFVIWLILRCELFVISNTLREYFTELHVAHIVDKYRPECYNTFNPQSKVWQLYFYLHHELIKCSVNVNSIKNLFNSGYYKNMQNQFCYDIFI